MKTIFLLTMVLATDTACLGLQASSPTSSTSLCPSTPPLALMSASHLHTLADLAARQGVLARRPGADRAYGTCRKLCA